MAIEILYLSSCMVNVSDTHVSLCCFFVSSSACHVTGLQWSNRGLARSRSFVLSSRLGTWGLQNGYMLHETDILFIVRSRIVWSIEHYVSGFCVDFTQSHSTGTVIITVEQQPSRQFSSLNLCDIGFRPETSWTKKHGTVFMRLQACMYLILMTNTRP